MNSYLKIFLVLFCAINYPSVAAVHAQKPHKQNDPIEGATESKEQKPCGQKNNDPDDSSEKRVLLVFSQMLTNFIAILKDPKNPANVGANLTALFAGVVNIGLEMFRDGKSESDLFGVLDEADQELIEKIKRQLIMAVEELKLEKSNPDFAEAT